MTTRRSPLLLLLGALTAGSLAMAPVVPFTGEAEGSDAEQVTLQAEGEGEAATEVEEPELHGPCTETFGATLISEAAGFDEVVPTPVGIANLEAPTDAAELMVDLEGLPVGTRARVTFTLDWDLPAPLGDYDLNINGANDLSVDQPEVERLTVGHCGYFDVDTEVFTGTPIDTLTLTADVTTIPPPAAPVAEPSPSPSPQA